MIQRSDILSIPYLKKAVFTGSFQGMRYRLEKAAQEEAECLKVTIWESPYNYEVTPEEKKESDAFPFSEEGIRQAVEWLNGKWEREPDRWRKARDNW